MKGEAHVHVHNERSIYYPQELLADTKYLKNVNVYIIINEDTRDNRGPDQRVLMSFS